MFMFMFMFNTPPWWEATSTKLILHYIVPDERIKTTPMLNDSFSPGEVLFFNCLKNSQFLKLLSISNDYKKIDDGDSSAQPKSEQRNRSVMDYYSYLTLFTACLWDLYAITNHLHKKKVRAHSFCLPRQCYGMEI